MTTIREFRPGLLLTEVSLDDFDVRGAVIIGDNCTVVWDSLSHPRDMQPVLPLLGRKHCVLVYTHADWDHIWGTAALSIHSKTIIAHWRSMQRFEKEAPGELREKQNARPGAWDEVVLVPPTLTIEDEFELTLGNISVFLHHLPGHTLDCIVGFIPAWGVLLAGDTVETPLPVINADSPIGEWMTRLQKWEGDERVHHIIPAHGKIGGRELLRLNIDYLQKLLAGIPPEVPDDLDDFYRKTHEMNLRYANL